jgi:hypothetical protein
MLIGVVGFAGSGKGTIGDVLIRDHQFVRLSFADALKDAVSGIFGWDRAMLEGDTKESREWREQPDEWWSKKFGYQVTPRLMLQKMGTEAGRDVFHDEIWIHTVAKRLEKLEHVVIPDVRFGNEIEFIRNNGGFIVQVTRGKNPKWYNIAQKANLEGNTDLMSEYNIHYSEWAWIGRHRDYTLDNNGSLIMLESDIKHMMKVFTGPTNSAIIQNVA